MVKVHPSEGQEQIPGASTLHAPAVRVQYNKGGEACFVQMAAVAWELAMPRTRLHQRRGYACLWGLPAPCLSLPDWAATLPACCRTWKRIEDHIGTKTAVQIRSHAQKFFSKLEKEQAAGAKGAAHLFSIRAGSDVLHLQHLPACLLLVEGKRALSSTCTSCSVVACCLTHFIWWGPLPGMALLILLLHLHTLGCRPGRPEHPPSAPQAQALAPLSAQGVWAH